MDEDVKEEVPQEAEEAPTEDSSTKETEKTVPYERFHEVIADNQELKAKLEEVTSGIQELKEQKSQAGLTEQQQAELNAKQTLAKMIRDEMSALQKEQKASAEKEQIAFDRTVASELALNPTVKRTEFLKFLEDEGDNFSSVRSAMNVYKKLNEVQKTSAEKTAKTIASKPGLPSNEGESKPNSYTEADKGKTLSQLAEEVKQNLK